MISSPHRGTALWPRPTASAARGRTTWHLPAPAGGRPVRGWGPQQLWHFSGLMVDLPIENGDLMGFLLDLSSDKPRYLIEHGDL